MRAYGIRTYILRLRSEEGTQMKLVRELRRTVTFLSSFHLVNVQEQDND